MPIQIIPAPNVPDPMQQMGQMYEMMTMMQQAPLKKQLLEAQILGQQQDSARADRQMSIAEQDAANRNAAAGREAKQAQRSEDVQAAQGAQMGTLLQEAVRIGKLTPEQAAAAEGVAKLGDPKLLPPPAQALYFDWQLKANPDLAIQHQTNQFQMQHLKQQMQETSLRIQKLQTGGGSPEDVKETVTAFNTLMDNVRQSRNDASSADIEASPEGAIARASAAFSRDRPGVPLYQSGPNGKPKPGSDGKPLPSPDFAGYIGAEMAKADQYKAKAEGARALEQGTLDFTKANLPHLASFFPRTFGGGQALPQPSKLKLAVATLDTTKAKAGDAEAAAIAQRLGVQKGPLFDASFDSAFPRETGEDDAQRAALKARIKAYLDYQPPAGPAANAGAAAGVRGP